MNMTDYSILHLDTH